MTTEKKTLDKKYSFHWNYDEALDWLEKQRAKVLNGGNMTLGLGSHDKPVITLGRHTPQNQLLNRKKLLQEGIQIRKIERGGGVTAHEPGQLVAYPVISLSELNHSIQSLTHFLEACIIHTLQEFGISAKREKIGPGVYVRSQKIASIGFHAHRGIITHGISINVANDLKTFSHITPCGLEGIGITSIHKELSSAKPTLEQSSRVFAVFFEAGMYR